MNLHVYLSADLVLQRVDGPVVVVAIFFVMCNQLWDLVDFCVHQYNKNDKCELYKMPLAVVIPVVITRRTIIR